ncbi:hypothetical protein NON00_12640 [Roseomonas sp. GC11]|uniref:hypothetical protein n=1 Tax=Roseomonas sp. GC11 TaxID=2950546 RepID=UPI00210D616D|nr:hypothetical protein [Roseomonas sp. GC11]MCQ4160775.1 hypothetical protein [Roseomonas sp. GC11]
MDSISPIPAPQAGAGTAQTAAPLPEPTERLDLILTTGRQLSSAKALLDVIRQVMEDVAGLSEEAARILTLMSEPGLPESSWSSALLRYQHAFHEIMALLAASRNVGGVLLQGAGAESNLAQSLQRMNRIAGLMPRAPQDRHEAMQAGRRFDVVRMAVEEARDSFTVERHAVEAQLAINLEQLDEENGTLGALEDTDLLKEAARLQALQIRQQLAGHAIGLGALVPRCLQDLRGP